MARKRWVLVTMAVLGAAAGQVATARWTSACKCASPEWRVELREVTSTDPGADHRMFWPPSGFLMAYPGEAHIWADPIAVGMVARVGIRR
jgi:hypothetical protein